MAYGFNDNKTKYELPTKLSQFTNDSGFITNTVNNLTNYYNKTQTDDFFNIESQNLTFSNAISGNFTIRKIPKLKLCIINRNFVVLRSSFTSYTLSELVLPEKFRPADYLTDLTTPTYRNDRGQPATVVGEAMVLGNGRFQLSLNNDGYNLPSTSEITVRMHFCYITGM